MDPAALFVVTDIVALGDAHQEVILSVDRQFVYNASDDLKVVDDCIGGQVRGYFLGSQNDVIYKYLDEYEVDEGSHFQVRLSRYTLMLSRHAHQL